MGLGRVLGSVYDFCDLGLFPAQLTPSEVSAYLTLGHLGMLHRWHRPERNRTSLPGVTCGGDPKWPPPPRLRGQPADPRSRTRGSHNCRGGAPARPNHCPRGGVSHQERGPSASAGKYPGGPCSMPKASQILWPFLQHPKAPSCPSRPSPLLPTSSPPRVVRSCGRSQGGGAWPAPSPGGASRVLRRRLGAASAAGTMLGRSGLTFLFLTVAVTCAVAQHVPPVGELALRAQGVRRCGRGREGGTLEHLVGAASLQVSVVSSAPGG